MDRYVRAWETGTAPARPKTLYLVRHGESTHNAQSFRTVGADVNDRRYCDAGLTPTGARQADALAPHLRELAPALIVCSPLTRAADTAQRACLHLRRAARVAVRPECAERLAYACDIGSERRVLEARFPALDWAALPKEGAWWWTPQHLRSRHGTATQDSLQLLRSGPPGSGVGVEPSDAVARRMTAFRRWLRGQPEEKIAVFAHGVYLKLFMDMMGASPPGALMFQNCEIRTMKL